jgi:P4 family phage/plasmid primase-like protien
MKKKYIMEQIYKMNPTIEELLRDQYVDASPFHSHVSMVQPKGKFQFSRKKLEQFWTLYCNKINNEKEPIIGVAEKPKKYLPVLVDLDLKILDDGDEDFGEHLYTEEQVFKVIQTYQHILKSIVEDCTNDHLKCILLEKPIYYIDAGDNTYAKNGFHLHFFNLFLDKDKQETHLIPRAQEVLEKLKLFENIGIENSGQLIDKASCQVPWLLYGSRKSEEMDPYLATKAFDERGCEISFEEALNDYFIYDDMEKQINIRDDLVYYLPRILSILPYGRPTNEMKPGLVSPIKEQIIKTQLQKLKQTKLVKSVEEELRVSAKLLPMLNDWRSEDRNEWMTIGWILYNIGDGSQQAMDQWIEFSSRCDEKYDESSCIHEWERMVKKNKTLGTLHFYARNDNPEKYSEFKLNESDHFIKDALNGSHNDIAQVLKSQFGNDFVCASICNETWFQFKDHHWSEIEKGTFLREKISSDVVNIYTEMGRNLFNYIGTQDKAEEAMYNARIKQVQKLVSNLKSSPFKNSVMREAVEVFYDQRFKNLLDQNPFLIGFKNGVYDLKLNIFRAGTPEDFISKVLPIDYLNYNMHDEEVLNVLDFFKKVFPDEEIRNYFLDTYSDIFVGGNNQKKVYMWTGDGDNGKSITQLFFDKMLGELSIKFNTQYFTGKKVASGSANPELARAAPPVRSVTMEEPDGDEDLKIGELKKLSGGDSFWARDLFEKGKSTREVFPMFMLTFICNKLPKLKYSDKATWNRMRVIPYESTFVEPDDPNCPSTLEQQMIEKRFPMDKDLKNKIPGMVSAFAWYLLEWRKKITIRKEPSKVQQATEEYRKQNDIYRQFIEEYIIEDDTTISLPEIYASFKEWYKEGWPNSSLPIKNEVKEYFEKIWGETNKSVSWKGYRIRTLQDDIGEGNAVVLEDNDLINYDCIPDI